MGTRLAEETERARVQVETEQLRSTLLSSVSHDLRTPLAVMKGVASTLAGDEDGKLTPAVRKDLNIALLEETERLDRQVRNLLDMTRLESGAVRLNKEWYSLQEIVGATWSRIDLTLPDMPVHSVVVHPSQPNTLYIGTDLGVFVTTDGGGQWLRENAGFANVITEHLEISGNRLYAFTHGRSLFSVPLEE